MQLRRVERRCKVDIVVGLVGPMCCYSLSPSEVCISGRYDTCSELDATLLAHRDKLLSSVFLLLKASTYVLLSVSVSLDEELRCTAFVRLGWLTPWASH